MIQQLTLRQTIALWGGFMPGRRLNAAVSYMDTTQSARAAFPDLPQSASVATLHIGVFKFIGAQFRGRSFGLTRELLLARAKLQAYGFTHICVAGPFLLEIRNKHALEPICAGNNARLISGPIAWLYRARLWVGLKSLSALGKLSKAKAARLAVLIKGAGEGFGQQGVFKL